MNETKWTPGKWFVESDGTTVTMAHHCVIVAPAPDGAPQSEMKANARLIASAPDLLAALERLTDAAMTRDRGNVEDALITARAAIASAKGE